MFLSPVSFFASRKVRDSFGVQNGFFFQAWTQAFFWLRASRKPAAAAGIKERENEKKGTKEKRERDERKDFFIISFGSVGTYGIDFKIFSAPNCRGWRSFVFYHGARNQTCRCSEGKRMLRFYFKFFPSLSFLLLFPHLELLSPF